MCTTSGRFGSWPLYLENYHGGVLRNHYVGVWTNAEGNESLSRSRWGKNVVEFHYWVEQYVVIKERLLMWLKNASY